MKKLKKPISMALGVMLAVAGSVSTLPVAVSADSAVATASESTSTSTSWNMSNSAFKGLGTISESTTVDGLTLIATSSKTMEVKAEEVTVGSNSFKYALALGGSGSAKYRAVSTEVYGSSTVKITGRSSGSESRTLNIADEKGNILGTVSFDADAAIGVASINYSGKIYIYSAGSGINIYKVQIDSKSDETTTKVVTTTEATTETTTKATTTKTTTTKATTTTTTESTTKAQATSQTKSWNMGNSSFKGLDTISSSTTIDGLKLLATSSKTMSVKSESVSVNGTDYSYALALGGTGSTSYRAVALDISGTSTIKVTGRSSGTATRTLNVTKADGTVLGTISYDGTASVGSVKLDYTGTVYIYSANSGINIYKVQIDTTGTLPGGTTTATTTKSETTTKKSETTTKKEATTETTTKATTTTTTTTTASNSKTVTNYSDLQSAVKSLASTGGTIYVNAKELSCSSQLALSSTKGKAINIVGVKQSDGTYPILNFKPMRDSVIGSSAGSLKDSGDSAVGVRITGSNYTLKNLIIQKAGDNGIQIKGSNANNNTVENCIVRYNNDAGVQITDGASNNKMRFVYSYRNCDVYTIGGNSDGFAPKLGATTGNSFYGCYSWENSDDGWDSFDKTTSGYTKDLTYEWCACWNNGNPDIFTGKYDFDNGDSLDTNLFLVELISKQDSSFATNYKKGKFSLPSGNFIKTYVGTISASSWAGDKFDGNPNGFKFGSVNSGSSLKRTVKNCLSFNHKNKGFDNNNSSCTGSFTNCVSYNNGYNYYLPPFTMSKWSNVLGFNGSSKDKLPSGYSASTPSSSEQSTIKSKVESTRKSIVSKCNSDIIPGEVYFDIF